ncbi:hypothetical protein H9Q70_011930 [Fusarium xylarioides]|nr:hypothetical protein H9Q70_011930 [Fusarium xylarioides]
MSSESRNLGHIIGQAYKTAMGGGDGSRRGGRRDRRRDDRRGGGRGGGRGHGGVDKSGRNCYHCNSPNHQRKDCPHRDKPRHGRGRQAALPAAEARAALPAPDPAAPSATSTPAVTATAPTATTVVVTSAATSAAPAPAPAATSAAPTPAPPLAQAPSELSSSVPPAPPPLSSHLRVPPWLPLGSPGEIPMSDAPAAPAELQANEGLAVSATTPAQQELARVELIFRVSTETGLSAADARSMLSATGGSPELSIRMGTMLFRVMEETGMHSEAAFKLLNHAEWDMSTVPLALSFFWPDGVIPDEHLRPSIVEARRQSAATMHESRQIDGAHEEL